MLKQIISKKQIRKKGSTVYSKISYLRNYFRFLFQFFLDKSKMFTRLQELIACIQIYLRTLLALLLSSRLFKVSYTTGIVTSAWKEANISSIFKKGTDTETINYKLMSIISIASKITKRILK